VERVRVALATKNPGKVREIAAIVSEAGVDLQGPSPSWAPPPETEPSYRGNALLKAHSLAVASGLPALADDSGIEVFALGDRPGHLSARYAGEGASDEANLDKLLAEARAIPEGSRGARYRCVAVLVTPEGKEEVSEATFEGCLILEPRGTNGFGYDPIFVPAGMERTAAELSPEEKDAISHRGKAFRGLLPALRALGA